MFLDLTQIRQPETPLSRTYLAEALAPGEDFRVVAPVQLTGTLHKDRDRFRLVGQLVSRLELACSRCVEPFQMPVNVPLDLRYLPQALAGNREEDPDTDPTTAFYSDDQIDLGAMVLEQCYLSLPMKPLCQSECRGLCVACGINFNTERCDCKPQWVDPRLAGLHALASSRTNDDA